MHLYEALMGPFLMLVSPSLQIGLLTKLDDKSRHFAIQALMQSATLCQEECGVIRVTSCLRAISPTFDSEA